jgi:hypothetical protein
LSSFLKVRQGCAALFCGGRSNNRLNPTAREHFFHRNFFQSCRMLLARGGLSGALDTLRLVNATMHASRPVREPSAMLESEPASRSTLLLELHGFEGCKSAA